MRFCPKCTEAMHIAERQGVEIDFCPVCRGVWLDAGELDKILERAMESELRAGDAPGSASPYLMPEAKGKKKKDKSGKYGKKYHKKFKKKHVLEEIFDLFD